MTLDSEIVAGMPVLMRYACKLAGNRVDGEDLVHDTIARALGSREQFTVGTNAMAWLFTIMRNHWIGEKRRLRNRIETLVIDEALDRRVEAQQENVVEIKRVLARIDALPERQRETMLMKLREERDEAIAERFGVPVGTVKSTVFRARSKIVNG